MRYVVIGGGIVGLATAYELTQQHPAADVTVLEKESGWARPPDRPQLGRHPRRRVLQAGQPQGAAVPGRGARRWSSSARRTASRTSICGKLIVATDPAELPRLQRAARAGRRPTGCRSRMIGPEQAREYEPNVACVAALHVASTGIVDYAPWSPGAWPNWSRRRAARCASAPG